MYFTTAVLKTPLVKKKKKKKYVQLIVPVTDRTQKVSWSVPLNMTTCLK